jgi:uncharacterized membrane protein
MPDKKRADKKLIYLFCVLGLLSAFTTALLELNTRLVVREYYNLAFLAVLIVLQIIIIFFISFRPNSGGVSFLTPPVLFTLAAYSLVDLFLYPSEFSVGMDNIYNADYLLKWIGSLFALIIAILLFYAVFRVISSLRSEARFFKLLRALLAALIFTLMIRDILAVIYIVLARGFIPQSDLIVNLTFFLSDYSYLFLFIPAFIGAAGASILYLSEKRKAIAGINPAVTRKLKAESIIKKRFAIFAIVLLSLSVLSLQGGKFLIDRNIELTPPIQVSAQEGYISFPLEDFADGRLKRYQYRTSGGVETRFIIIKKPRGGYGVGLDACEICGPTGYYEKKDRVICIRCDVSINVNTIGFQGGCNPVPIAFEIREQKLFIAVSVLEDEERRFQ